MLSELLRFSTYSDGKAGSSTCRIRIDNIPYTMSESVAWFDVWAAAEAINAICVRSRRREGVAPDLGKSSLTGCQQKFMY